MSEPDVAGSVLAVISLGIQISASLFNFIQVARGAPKELEAVHNDTLALCGILEQLRDLLVFSGIHLNPYLVEKALANCSKTFGTVKSELEKAGKSLQLRGSTAGKVIMSLKERTGYFYMENNISKLRMEMQISKLTFLLAINVAQLYKLDPRPPMLELGDKKSHEHIQLIATTLRLNDRINLMGKKEDPESHSPSDNTPGQEKFPEFQTTALVKTEPEIPPLHIAKPFKREASATHTGKSTRNDNQVGGVRLISTEGTSADQSTRRRMRHGVTHQGVDNWLSDVTESSTTSDSRQHPPPQKNLEAWMMDVNVDTDPPDVRCRIHPVELQQDEILEYMKLQKELHAAGTLEFLSGLNNVQRPMLLRHLQSVGGELVMANFCDDGQTFNFGTITLQTLMWITERQKHQTMAVDAYASADFPINEKERMHFCQLKAIRAWIRRRMRRTPKVGQHNIEVLSATAEAKQEGRRVSIDQRTKKSAEHASVPDTSFDAHSDHFLKQKRRESYDLSTEISTNSHSVSDSAHTNEGPSRLRSGSIVEIEIDEREAEETIQGLFAKWIEE